MFLFDLLFRSDILIGISSVLLVHFLVKNLLRIWKLPSGPWGLSVVGYLPFIKKDTHIQFTDFYKRYGPVFSLRIGSFDVVVVNGWPAIKEAFANDDLTDRPGKDFFAIFKDASIMEMSGDEWREQRRVTLTTLRNVGLGKSKMEETIKEEIECFVGKLKSQTNKPLDFDKISAQSLPNNISILLFGHKFDYEDPKKLELDNNFRTINVSGSLVNFIVFMPWITKTILRLNLIAMPELLKAIARIEKFIADETDEHPVNPFGEVNDYIDGFLQEMKKHEKDERSTFKMSTLKRNAVTFYTAGSDTTRQSLCWIMQILAAYPEFQAKIREEIYSVIGHERAPENSDRQSMPYTMAFIYEAQRIASIAAVNLPRCATKDTFVAGQLIPKDTLVYFNFWSVHRDPILFPDPEKFDPTRFLNEDKTKAIKHPHLVAFSGGKRVCPGESLGYLLVFLYLVNIIQKFEIQSNSKEKVSLGANFTFLRLLKHPVDIIFKEIESTGQL